MTVHTTTDTDSPADHAVVYSVQNAGKTYKYSTNRGKRKKLRAVDGVSFDIRAHETLGLVGESGCGKSTLGRAIVGLEELSDGSVSFQGRDLKSLSRSAWKTIRSELQIIFQDPYGALNPRLRIGQALAEPLRIHSALNAAERKEKVEAILARVGLSPEDATKFPHQFSGGQRQRICIARALIVDPTLVVCDEAVSALDVSIRADVLDLLADLQEQMDLTYVFISHDLGVVRAISDTVMVMYLGHMMEYARAEDLFARPRHPYTKALMAAAPRADPSTRTTRTRLAGEPPDPTDPPTGCVFNTRCPFVTQECLDRVPEWRPIDGDHMVACHRADEDFDSLLAAATCDEDHSANR